MREQLVALLVSKVGLDEEKAGQAVDTVLDYVKSNPQELTAYLEKFGAGGLTDKIGGFFGN